MTGERWQQNIPLGNIEGGTEWLRQFQAMSEDELRQQLEEAVAELPFEEQAQFWRSLDELHNGDECG